MKLLAIGLLLTVGLSGAQDIRPGRYQLLGHGATVSCGTWTTEGQTGSVHHTREAWVLGFVSGAGYAARQTLHPTDADAILAYLDLKCAADPLASVSQVTTMLVVELIEKGR
jgi:hypothetical protein